MEGILDLAKKNEQLLKGAAAASSATLLGAYLLCRTQTNNVLSDIKETIELVRMRNDLKRIEGTKDWTVVDLFDQNVVSNPEGDAFCFVGEPNQPARTVSFREADEASNRSLFLFSFLSKLVFSYSLLYFFYSSCKLGNF